MTWKTVLGVLVLLVCMPFVAEARGRSYGRGGYYGYSGYGRGSYGSGSGYVSSSTCVKGEVADVPPVDQQFWFDGAIIGMEGYKCVGEHSPYNLRRLKKESTQ